MIMRKNVFFSYSFQDVNEHIYLKKLEGGLSILEANAFVLANLYLTKEADVISLILTIHNSNCTRSKQR